MFEHCPLYDLIVRSETSHNTFSYNQRIVRSKLTKCPDQIISIGSSRPLMTTDAAMARDSMDYIFVRTHRKLVIGPKK